MMRVLQLLVMLPAALLLMGFVALTLQLTTSLEWYYTLTGFLLVGLMAWHFHRRRRQSGLLVNNGEARDPWSRSSERLDW